MRDELEVGESTLVASNEKKRERNHKQERKFKIALAKLAKKHFNLAFKSTFSVHL